MLKKLKGGLIVAIGYLLSPLCWWNDAVINLPIACGFGYIFSLLSADLLIPCSIAGYWLSNVAGILMMQFGAADVLQEKPARDFKKELLTGFLSSTVYTLFILALIQFNILPVPALINAKII